MASTMEETSPTDKGEQLEKLVAPQAAPWDYVIQYDNVLQLAFIHASGLYGLYLCFTSAKWATIFFCGLLTVAATIGVYAGAHRLWSHRSYKAKLPLHVLLMLFQTLSFEDRATRWAADHRMHHKYSDTDADPYNAARGFFFSHFGWLVVKRHPEFIKRRHTVDVKDIYENPALKFQYKYFLPLTGVIAFALPTIIPMYFWGESFINAFSVCFLRIIFVLNGTCLVNSAGHSYGYKPYDKNILATQNIHVSLATLGECFHNFHHAFPFDYRTGELGNNRINFTTKFIDFFAWTGWAYDLKSASDIVVLNRAKRTGDGTDLWGTKLKDFKNEGGVEKPYIPGCETTTYLKEIKPTL